MRWITGTVLTLLVAGAVYLNFTAPPHRESGGRGGGDASRSAPAPERHASAELASARPERARDPGRASVPELATIDPARDLAGVTIGGERGEGGARHASAAVPVSTSASPAQRGERLIAGAEDGEVGARMAPIGTGGSGEIGEVGGIGELLESGVGRAIGAGDEIGEGLESGERAGAEGARISAASSAATDGDALPSPDAAASEGAGAFDPDSPTIELHGRIFSSFGEGAAGLEVLSSHAGDPAGSARTDAEGRWSIAGLPAGELAIDVRGDRLMTPLVPMLIRPNEGQRRVRVPDLILDLRRVFRISGRVVVGEEELAAFGRDLATRSGGRALERAEVLRAYLRGLHLEQRNVGSPTGRAIPIGDAGEFEWSCDLPASDVELTLAARATRAGGDARSTRVLVTPAGDRTVSLALEFPPRGACDEGPSRAPE